MYTLCFLIILATASETFSTWEIMTIGRYTKKSSCSLVFWSLLHLIWRLTLLEDYFGYPHARRASSTSTYIAETGRKFGSVTGTQDWNGIQNRTHIHYKPSCIKFNRTQQIRSHRPRNSREPMSSTADLKRRRSTESQLHGAFYQMDQRGHTHPKGRTTGHEPWWGRIRRLPWHGVFPSCQEPEELSTSFFWWRPLI